MSEAQSRLVQAGTDEPKSGCCWCPLFPFAEGFGAYAAHYQRDAEAILRKNRDDHAIKTHCVSEPWTKVRVLFVGEAPSKDDDKKGAPLSAGPGGLLKRTIENATSLRPGDYGFTNIVACRPSRNRAPNNTEVKSCSPRLIREIQARQPELVVVLGNHALDFLTGNTGITSFVGRVVPCTRPEFPGLKVLACLHPSFVLRFDHEIDKFYTAIASIPTVLAGKHTVLAGEGSYEVLTDIDEIERRFAKISEAKKLVAHDTETGSLSPFQTKWPKLLCVSFSHTANKAFTIPIDHADAPAEFRNPGPVRDRLKKCLIDFYTDSDVPKVAHNGKFDRNHIRATFDCLPVNETDSMLLHYVQDERQGTHDLGKLSHALTGMGGYDKPLDDHKARNANADPNKGGSYANIPGEILFKYAAMDADVTRRVTLALRQEAEWANNPALRRLSKHFYPQLSNALAELEWNGATIDVQMVEYLDKTYTREMARIAEEIQSDPQVVRFVEDRRADKGKDAGFNPDSWQQLGKILFGYYDLRPIELNESGMDLLKSRLEAQQVAWRDRPGKKIGPDQPDFNKLVEAAIDAKEWDLFSTKADVLQEYARAGNTFVTKILEFRAYSTLHGTFVVPLLTKLDAQRRVHGTYKPHGTVTGRLASSDPNLQNIPNKGGGLVKRCYVSRFGDEGVIVQADYSQIELRVAACLFEEPTMIDAYRRGDDLHTLTAIAISKLPKDKFKALPKDQAKGWRTRAKRVNFGVLYGGGPPALVSTLGKDGVFITQKEAEDLIDTYFKARPTLKRNMDKLMESVQKNGYLVAFTGHRRRVPEVFSKDEKIVARALRQSVNFPVQCGAAQMTNMAMILIQQRMREVGFKSQMTLTVHDSIVFDAHVDEMVEIGKLAKEVMENLPSMSESVLPKLDWSWLTVPIVAELEIGFTWGTGVELKEAKLGKEERALDINNLDIDYLWAAMEERSKL